MKYRVIKTCSKGNDNCYTILKNDLNEQFISNGVYIWEATKDRINKLNITNNFDRKKFIKLWNKHQGYNTVTF